MISAILLRPTKLYTAAQKYPFKMDKQASSMNPAITSKLCTTRPLRQFNWVYNFLTRLLIYVSIIICSNITYNS